MYEIDLCNRLVYLHFNYHFTVAKKVVHVHQWISRIRQLHRHCLHKLLILHADYIPPSLHAFLADPRHTFCGVGIQEDAKKLYDHHGLRVGSVADLNELARLASGDRHSEYRYMGLKKMAVALLGKEMLKQLQVTLSTWDAVNLDTEQIEYAAIDAFVSFKLGFTLFSRVFH
ncbi:hypothetical protein Pfo_031304 [Paulownia fortunei]|nr:hypothetical protein Pfo_031304 [Paulownia fortunei]